MVLNTVAVNQALGSGYRTGDVNGPTLVWADMPFDTSLNDPGDSRYFLLLALRCGTRTFWETGESPTSATWSKETV